MGKINYSLQNFEDKCSFLYRDVFDGKIHKEYKLSTDLPDEIIGDYKGNLMLEEFGISCGMIKLAEYVETILKDLNEKTEEGKRVEIRLDEEKLNEFGYFIFNSLHVYLYRNSEYPITSNYMTFVHDNDNMCFMVDLYFRKEEYDDIAIVSSILQEFANYMRDIPLYLQEKFEEEKNKEKDLEEND